VAERDKSDSLTEQEFSQTQQQMHCTRTLMDTFGSVHKISSL